MSRAAASSAPSAAAAGYYNPQPSMFRILQPRAFRNMLEELEEKDVIKSEKTSKGKGDGVHNLYCLNMPLDIVGAIALGPLWQEIISAKDNLAQLEFLRRSVDANILWPEMRQFYNVWLDERINEIKDRTMAGKPLS
jgi:hypothetical protein